MNQWRLPRSDDVRIGARVESRVEILYFLAEPPGCEMALNDDRQFPFKKPAPLHLVRIRSERFRVRITSFRRAVLNIVQKRACPRLGDIRVGELVELAIEMRRWREPSAFSLGQIMSNQLLFRPVDSACLGVE